MKSVSTAYKNSMKKLLRNPSHVEIEFKNVDTTVPEDGEWGSNGVISWSDFDTLDYSFDYSAAAYATLELNRWIGDGSMDIAPISGLTPQGYCSSNLSDNDGSFAAAPMLERPFNQNHTFPGVTLTFDTRCKEWPRAITVRFYKNGSVADTKTVTGIDRLTVEVPTSVMDIDGISITFDEILPYHRARMEQVLYGVIRNFEDVDIISVQQKHDVDPLTRRLPKETFSFTIHDLDLRYDPDNPQGIYAYIDVRSPITIRHGYELDDGNVEWIKPDRYVLNGKPQVKNYQATFTGTGMIGSLSKTYYKGTFGNKSFYDMAEDVLRDAGLTLTEQGTNPWEIDPALKSMYCSNPLPIDTHMNCLQLIAHACCCRLYTDDDNIIHIRPFSITEGACETDFVLDFSTISEKTQQTSKTDELREIDVSLYRYTPDSQATKLFEGSTTETIFHIELRQPATDIAVSVSGGTLVSYKAYAQAVDMVLSSGTKTITITGIKQTETEDVATYKVNQNGEVDKEQNPLISNETMRLALANHFISYLGYRSTYDAEYRGNPELETGDIIKTQTNYTNEMNALILVDELKYNGTLSGKLKVKGLI